MNNDFDLYAGRWIAVINGKVVGQGGTPEQAALAAANARHKEIPKIVFVPTQSPMIFPTVFHQVRDILTSGLKAYLVGGAIRDALLRQPIHDFDIILDGDSLGLARKVADRLNGAYFPLDEKRKVARVILRENKGTRIVIDFAVIQGDLESDLRERDFTINAIALSLFEPDQLLDPLGGGTDLVNKTLRACSNTTFICDPVRILRAIRLAVGYGLKILPETRALMTAAISLLVNVSPERLRDELFRILEGKKPATSILALDVLGLIPYLLPELVKLKNVSQSSPHIKDVWSHTLDTLIYLEMVLDSFRTQIHDLSSGINSEAMKPEYSLILDLSKRYLGKFREKVLSHQAAEIVLGRSLRSIIFFAGLYHDSGKPAVRTIDGQGRIRFFDHENLGSLLVAERGEALRLSNMEIDRLKTIVKGHMRSTQLANSEEGLSPRAVYRFFRDTGEAGIDICLLSLADLLATYGPAVPQERWVKQLDITGQMMDAWWNSSDKKINPESLIRGSDLLAEFNLKPGPIIGQLIEMVREAQVEGKIQTREEGLRFVREILEIRGEGI
jgi:tRNA nucleotidyltransferase/poly(A) polymerase